MKKKLLAAVLATMMVLGSATGVMADPSSGEEGGEEEINTPHEENKDADHGDSSEAALGDDAPAEQQADESYTATTDIYMRVAKDATSTDGKKIDNEEVVGTGETIYLIQHQKTEKINLSVTVPLYVCMYAYGGDGRVVVPDENAYKMTNESTKTVSDEVTAIYPMHEVKDLTADDTTVLKAIEDGYAEVIAGDDASDEVKYVNTYYSYYKDTNDKYHVVLKKDCIEVETGKFYYMESQSISSVNVKLTQTQSKNYEVGKVNGDTEGEIVHISGINVNTPSNWKLVSTDANLKAHQFTMSINSLDLSAVASTNGETKNDITNLGWNVKASLIKYDSTNKDYVVDPENKGTLELPIRASIAGGNVNDDQTEAKVVQVTYTIVPETSVATTTEDKVVHSQLNPPSDES